MPVIHPVSKDKASLEIHGIYDTLGQKFGKMPNLFGLMAHRPNVLKTFLPFYNAVLAEGTVEPKLKELAYLKASMINGCEY